MKIFSAIFGTNRKIEDDFVILQTQFSIPYDRFELCSYCSGNSGVGADGELVGIQVRYKYVKLEVTYQFKSWKAALEFAEKLRTQCPRHWEGEQDKIGRYRKLFYDSSEILNSRPLSKGKNMKRINAPLFTPGIDLGDVNPDFI